MRIQEHPNLQKLKAGVIDAGLCTRCGTCVGICPEEKLGFDDLLGECLPVAVKGKDCGNCPGLCLDGCPGAEVHFIELNRQVFGKVPDDFLLGNALEWSVGWSGDEEIRSNGASGGAITAIAKHLLETRIVKGVVCLIDDPRNPLIPKPVIARDWETLRLSQQSRYSLAPVNTILREVEALDGPVAFVALPDQVHALRKLQQLSHPAVENIKIIMGSYCGAVQHFTAIIAFLKKHDVTNLSEVVKVEYRAGPWPGKLRITLRNGRRFELEKFYANYMTLLYSVERSLLCVDLSNELSDLSFGDAWAPKYEGRHEGFNLVAVRTDTGKEIFDACREGGIIHTIPVSRDESVGMHSHGLYNKKYAVWSRIDLRRWQFKKVPQYGYVARRTAKQKLIGLLIALVFEFGRTRLARFLLQMFAPELIGRAFSLVRKKWRKATRPGRSRNLRPYNIRFT